MAAAHRTPSKKKTPSLRHHKATGQAYVVLNRRAAAVILVTADWFSV